MVAAKLLRRYGPHHLDPATVALVFVGGCVGTAGRAGLVQAFDAAPGTWPWSTLLANLAGSYLLGRVVRAVRSARLGDRLQPLLATGLAGSLTTFSSFAVESIEIFDVQGLGAAVLYTGVSVTVGLAAAASGVGGE